MKLPRLNFHRSKLRDKILLSILSVVTIVFIVVFAYIIINNEKIATERAYKYVNASAHEHVNLLKTQLESDF
ncbi:MAG: hypothetical protein C0595_02190 [Marinilabiliales bacterium]|nr:MAG: hypothetical protein C0595_02190 [Marinilabiliales bacterium]